MRSKVFVENKVLGLGSIIRGACALALVMCCMSCMESDKEDYINAYAFAKTGERTSAPEKWIQHSGTLTDVLTYMGVQESMLEALTAFGVDPSISATAVSNGDGPNRKVTIHTKDDRMFEFVGSPLSLRFYRFS